MSKHFTILDRSSSVDAASPLQWRSLEDLKDPSALAALERAESPQGALELDTADGVTRRGFMGLAGATLAGASAALTGCIRKPAEFILPYSRRPEDVVPGQPVYFATAAHVGGEVVGLLVESQEGRPTKIEGNPKHPSSGGRSGSFAQSSVMDLYDPDRSKALANKGAEADWTALWAAVDGKLVDGGHTANIASLCLERLDIFGDLFLRCRKIGGLLSVGLGRLKCCQRFLIGLERLTPACVIDISSCLEAFDLVFQPGYLLADVDARAIDAALAQGRRERGRQAPQTHHDDNASKQAGRYRERFVR